MSGRHLVVVLSTVGKYCWQDHPSSSKIRSKAFPFFLNTPMLLCRDSLAHLYSPVLAVIHVGLHASLCNLSPDPNHRILFGCKSCIRQRKATSEDAYLQRHNALFFFSNHTLAWTVSAEIYCTFKMDVHLKRNY